MDQRLDTFRREAHERGFAPHTSPKEASWSHAFFDLYADLPLPERQARSFVFALTHEPVLIHPPGLIAGQIYQACPGAGCPERSGTPAEPRWGGYAVVPVAQRRLAAQVPGARELGRFFDLGGYPGHICWDFGLMLEHGVEGMLDRCQQAAAATHEPQARTFHACAGIVLGGLLTWAELHADVLEEMAGRTRDAAARAEALEMARLCRTVPRRRAATFRQAVQAFWFQHLAVMYENPFGGNGPGRLDYYLWPYLEADLEAGRTTMQEARALVTELLVKLHERIAPADGWVEAVPVGGRAPDGSLAVNPLSHVIIEAICELQQTHPSVYVRLPDDAPAEFVELAARYLVDGGNRAQIYGDDAVIRAVHDSGVALEDARHWTAGGCMEVSPQGCNGDLLFSFAHKWVCT